MPPHGKALSIVASALAPPSIFATHGRGRRFAAAPEMARFVAPLKAGDGGWPGKGQARRGLFITATDTGVGKTYVGTRLAAWLTGRGKRVRPRKPVESGCPRSSGGLEPPDAIAYHIAVGGTEPVADICRHRFEAALAPDRAARLEGRTLRLRQVLAACLAGVGETEFLLVEGAGGFYSPIAEDGLNADLAIALGLPVLLVSADRLGAIHQVLVTAEAIVRRGLEMAGVVLCRLDAGIVPALDNAADLRRWLACAVITLAHGDALEDKTETEPALKAWLERLASSY